MPHPDDNTPFATPLDITDVRKLHQAQMRAMRYERDLLQGALSDAMKALQRLDRKKAEVVAQATPERANYIENLSITHGSRPIGSMIDKRARELTGRD